MVELIIRLRQDLAATDAEGNIDWLPALRAAATEVQQLNAFSGTETFPTPIPCDPEAEAVEQILGSNTPPSEAGHVTVRINEYNSLETALFPAMPQTFTFTFGSPDGVGRFM